MFNDNDCRIENIEEKDHPLSCRTTMDDDVSDVDSSVVEVNEQNVNDLWCDVLSDKMDCLDESRLREKLASSYQFITYLQHQKISLQNQNESLMAQLQSSDKLIESYEDEIKQLKEQIEKYRNINEYKDTDSDYDVDTSKAVLFDHLIQKYRHEDNPNALTQPDTGCMIM
jgi:predicted RNase H-like nuclease (RuvC/YqgF family)